MNFLLAIGLVAVVFFTSLLSGVFGMAGGLILLWLLLFLVPVTTAIAVHGVIQVVSNSSRAIFSRQYIDWRIVTMITAGGLVAALLFALVRYQPDLAMVNIVVGMLPILVWVPRSWLQLDASKPPQAVFCGFIAGGLSIAVGVSGPVIDIFFIRTQMDRRVIIATKATTQSIAHFIKVVFYAGALWDIGGLEWTAILIAAPVAILGTRAGNVLLQRLTDVGFRTWTRYIVSAIGIVYFTRGVLLLIGGGA